MTAAPQLSIQDGGRPAGDRSVLHRPARAYPPPVPTGEVVVAAPPLVLPVGGVGAGGWLSALLPLLGGGGSLLFLLAGPGPGSRGRWLLFGVVGMLLASVGGGLALRLRERRLARAAERRRRARYLAYLRQVDGALRRVAAVQRAAAEHAFPALPELWSLVNRGDRIWERRPSDRDFLVARVGLGAVPLAVRVRLDLGGDPLAERDPELLAAADATVRDGSWLADAPVTIPLRGGGVVAVAGPRDPARALARSVLVQLAAFHAPADLRILVAYPPEAAASWSWLKWLPHVRDAAAVLRPGSGAAVPPCRLAAGPDQLAHLLDREVRPRLARSPGPSGVSASAPVEPPPPRLVVVVDGFSPRGPLRPVGLLGELLARADEAAATVVCLIGERADEPSELRTRIELDERGSLSITAAGPDGATVGPVQADSGSPAFCEAVARRLAPLRLGGPDDQDGQGLAGSPGPVRLLDLLGVRPDSPDGIGRWPRWDDRRRKDLLRSPIGVRHSRDLGGPGPAAGTLVLDLKEAADGGMGPHGLLIGATGSGKSELLRTLVAGLAITHPPEVLSFVLIDFKGGAAFAGLAELPHGAGLITNLEGDLTMVDRVRAALDGERERRQRLLRAAGDLDGIGHYQARRAADPGLGPLPYLLVVVDEFGELLAARPDFIDLFTSIGRVGRSLGMHLLLASQRLDEGRVRGLESHLRYRICLRTFSPAESISVLGTPDAYHLPASPGTALLAVDGQAPQRFDAAMVSIARQHQRRTHPPPALVLPFDPEVADRRGPARGGAGGPRGPTVARPSHPPSTAGGPGRPARPRGTDMRAVVEALAGAGHREGLRAHRIWLPPLPGGVVLADLLPPGGPARAARWLQVPVGLVDKPFEQAQEPLVLDFSGGEGHLAIIGAPRSGKSTLLATIVAAFALTQPPDAVQFYCIDLGGGLLHRLAGLPHVGAVCGPHDRAESRHLVRELGFLIADRERLFRRHRLDSMAAWHRLRRARPELDEDGYGEVFLLVDNWARLRQDLDDLEPEIEALAATGLHYGVHVIVAANRWADLRLGLRDNLGGRLELRLNDPLDSQVSRAAAATLPRDVPGRGLTAAGLRFQAALPGPAGAEPAEAAELGAELELARRAVRGPEGAAAPPLRMLPSLVRAADLPEPGRGQPDGVPFALHERRLQPVWLDLFSAPHLLVLGDAGCGKSGVLRRVARGLALRHQPDELRLVVADYRGSLADPALAPLCAAYARGAAELSEAATLLRAILDQRVPMRTPGSPLAPGAGSRWTGPRYVLMVDDYDLVAAAGGNPLDPLLELLALARDIGLHVVLARPVSGTARAAFEPFFQRLREVGCSGLIMSGDPQEGPLLGGHAAVPLPPGRGVLVQRRGHGPNGLVQVAWDPPPSTRPARASPGSEAAPVEPRAP